MNHLLALSAEVAEALNQHYPVVALESTVIAQGLPWPDNLACAYELEACIRAKGAIPATIALADGKIRLGLEDALLERLAKQPVAKASSRDLAWHLARGSLAATTVAATLLCAQLGGIKVFATGGIGGVHPQQHSPWDISTDLMELARRPLITVCAGAKSVLDLPATLELLETLAVPVLGYRCQQFPAFYVPESGLALTQHTDSVAEIAHTWRMQRALGQTAGLLVTQAIAAEYALPTHLLDTWLVQAKQQAQQAGVHGAALTPFLLARLHQLSAGRSLLANRALLQANASLAAEIAVELQH